MYPDEVSGMVLVDPTQPEALEPVAEVKAWLASHAPEQMERVEAALSQLEPPGYDIMVAAEFKRLEQALAGIPEPRRARLRRQWWSEFDQSLPAGKVTMSEISPGARGEMQAAAETFRQAIASSPLPDVPIVLLTAGKIPMDLPQAMNPLSRELFDESLRSWYAGHKQWVDQTPGARLVVAETSGHNIQSEQPQFVIDAIRDVVEQAARKRQRKK
jgi:pimeloyl-ACP methyl ester carboxylesterase